MEAEGGNYQHGEGTAKMGRDGNNKDNAQQLLLYIKSHYLLIFHALPSRRDANPSNINLIFMDVMC